MDQSTIPLVSVVMPVWNGERYLAAAIESVLSQTFSDFELLVMDDGSVDQSKEITGRYAEADGRVRLVSANHQGLVAALNAGCGIARGKYIARLDSDDIALPERLELQSAFLESNPEAVMVGSGIHCITTTGERTNLSQQPPTDDATIRQRLNEGNCFCHSSVMMRKDPLDRVGGYRSAFTDAEDYDLWMRFADQYQLANLASTLVFYRLHPQQVSLIRIERQGLVALAVRVSTNVRRATGQDPISEGTQIERETLLNLGVTDQEIDAYLIEFYIKCIATMPKLGLGRPVLQALREVIAYRSILQELESIPASALHKA